MVDFNEHVEANNKIQWDVRHLSRTDAIEYLNYILRRYGDIKVSEALARLEEMD